MKNLYLLLSIIFIFAACNKDSVTIDKKTEIDPPVEIDGALIKGIISSNTGKKVADVAIDIYQNDKNIGRIYSDENGHYTTASIPINPNSPVALKYSKENFEKKYRRYDFEEATQYSKDIILGIKPDSSDVKEDDFELTNPSDTSYIKLYGYTKLADGTPVAGVKCTAIWKYELIEFLPGNSKVIWVREFVTDYSDADGYFELLVPQNKDVYFNAEKVRFPDQKFSSCTERFSIFDSESELRDISYQKLGMFDEDSEVELRDDVEFETISTHVTGNAYRCDGTPVAHGTLAVGITIAKWFSIASKKIENYTFGPNGEFSVDLETCPHDNADYGIIVNIKDTDVNFFNIEEFDFEEYADVGQIDLCFDDNDYPDEFEMTIESVTRQYPSGGDSPLSGKNNLHTGFYYEDGDYDESVFLAANDIHLGEVPIIRFEMWKGKKEGNVVHGYETTFKAKPEDVTLTITKIEGDYIYGNVSGNVDTPRGREPVNATFKIYDK